MRLDYAHTHTHTPNLNHHLHMSTHTHTHTAAEFVPLSRSAGLDVTTIFTLLEVLMSNIPSFFSWTVGKRPLVPR